MNRIKKNYHRKIIKIKSIEPIQPTMKIATAYKPHITRWKGVFRALRLKKVSNIAKTKK